MKRELSWKLLTAFALLICISTVLLKKARTQIQVTGDENKPFDSITIGTLQRRYIEYKRETPENLLLSENPGIIPMGNQQPDTWREQYSFLRN